VKELHGPYSGDTDKEKLKAEDVEKVFGDGGSLEDVR